MHKSHDQFPISHVKTVKPLTAGNIRASQENGDGEYDTYHKGRTASHTKLDTDNSGNEEYYESHTAMKHPQTNKLQGHGFTSDSGSLISDPNKARQVAFNRASTEYTQNAKKGVK